MGTKFDSREIRTMAMAQKWVLHVAGMPNTYAVKEENLRPLVGQRIVKVDGRFRVNGGFWKELTPRGMVNHYGVIEAWEELLEDSEEGAIWDSYGF